LQFYSIPLEDSERLVATSQQAKVKRKNDTKNTRGMEQVSLERLQRLISKFSNRMQTIILAKGGSTRW
jgi:hypothetical protein